MARPGFWIDTLVHITALQNTQTSISLMTNVSATQSRRGWTCVRTIIGLDIARTVHDSGEGSELVSFGIAVASQEAFAASALSDSEIATDHPTRGWLFRAQYRIYGFAADQPAVYNMRVDKDIRAKRKLDNGEMFLTAMSLAQDGTFGASEITGIVRQYWLDE